MLPTKKKGHISTCTHFPLPAPRVQGDGSTRIRWRSRTEVPALEARWHRLHHMRRGRLTPNLAVVARVARRAHPREATQVSVPAAGSSSVTLQLAGLHPLRASPQGRAPPIPEGAHRDGGRAPAVLRLPSSLHRTRSPSGRRGRPSRRNGTRVRNSSLLLDHRSTSSTMTTISWTRLLPGTREGRGVREPLRSDDGIPSDAWPCAVARVR